MTPGQRDFLENSVAGPVGDLLKNGVRGAGPSAAGALGAQSEERGTGDPLIDAYEKSTKSQDKLTTAWNQLERLQGKTDPGGPTEYQYALMAKADGLYPDVRGGTVQLKMGDVWKFGTSWDTAARYPQPVLDELNLSMVQQTRGTRLQVLIQEKLNLIGYYITHGQLPPGNRIFK